jgi:hypothetical protein
MKDKNEKYIQTNVVTDAFTNLNTTHLLGLKIFGINKGKYLNYISSIL